MARRYDVLFTPDTESKNAVYAIRDVDSQKIGHYVTIRGIMGKNTLLIEVEDGRRTPGKASICYFNHRSPQVLNLVDGRILCRETNLLQENKRPLPEGKKPSPTDLIYGRSLHLAIALDQDKLLPVERDAHSITAKSAAEKRNYRFFVTAEVTTAGNAIDIAAVQSRIMNTPGLIEKQKSWWKDFWSRSFIVLRGDPDADYLNKLWFVNLYSLAGVHGGVYPPRFSGGLGSVRADNISWGHGYWFQNQREISWPLGAANHPEIWRRWRM